MDEPMDKKAKERKDRTSDDAPSYMQPRKPVLEEPLMGEEKEAESDGEESQEPGPKLEDEVREGKIQEDIENSSMELEREEPPYSPYFPRGIYEDAKAVEAYYGRGEG
jgi:hypothetical protein